MTQSPTPKTKPTPQLLPGTHDAINAGCLCTLTWTRDLPHHDIDTDPRDKCAPGCEGCKAERKKQPVGKLDHPVLSVKCPLHGTNKQGIWR